MTGDTASDCVEAPPSLAQITWWHKPLIWSALLVLLYLLREFFLIGFLTFLFCFIVRSAVGILMRRLSPNGDDPRLDLILTLSIFRQVLIAFFNACLTLVALWMIGVEYKFILALVVFVFSFIPVVGVILSGIPICAIAILQVRTRRGCRGAGDRP